MHLVGSSSMSYGSNFTNPTSQNGKRSTSCSHDYSVSNNNNNRFYSRYPATGSGASVLGQSGSSYGQYKSPSYGQYKTTSYLRTPIKLDGRLRPRDSVPRDPLPLRPTYRPENSSERRDSRFGSLSKPTSNFDVGDLGFSGLSVSSPKGLKKSNSQQDMNSRTTHFDGRIGVGGSYPSRPLPEFSRFSLGRGATLAQTSLSTSTSSSFSNAAHASRRSTFVSLPPKESPVIRKFVPDAVARLGRRGDEGAKGVTRRRTDAEPVANGNGDASSSSSSSTSSSRKTSTSSSVEVTAKSPNNNNINNFSQKYMSKGCTGLQNIGNTCFMNCVLQCLANTRPLLELCLGSEILREVNRDTSRLRGSLVTSYVDLMQSMWKGYDSISPSSFKYEVSKFARLFAGYNQQDAQEFLMYLLQGLHEELNRVRVDARKNRKRQDRAAEAECHDPISASEKAVQAWKIHLELENSHIVDLFEGLLKSALKCRLCGYVSDTFDPFLGLSLPIKKVPGHGETTLMECLELFTHEELLDENEKSTCDKCHRKQNSTKRLSIQKFPKILIINLKRFSEESLFRSKLSTLVRCPIKGLDLRQFSDENVGDRAAYNLYGVCNHSGTPMGGHYTALAKNPFSNEWHYFNDQRVSGAGENINLVSSEAYILFYEMSNSK